METIRTLALVAIAAALPLPAAAQDRRDEQFYYPGSFNWTFLKTYPEAARLFNAFDYGHAVLYETLYTKPDSPSAAAELEKQYRFLTTDLLLSPPRFAVAEEVIEPSYAKLAWRAKLMFDWAHMLHRQIYDAYADERIPEGDRAALVERLTDYYLSRPDIAFVPVAKSMALMDEQYYSQVFRNRYPKFNGLIWAYHWLQVGLYEPLIAGATPQEKRAGVQAAVARFWEMLEDPPGSMPRVMPMTATVAPLLTARHPRAAAIFDNLHMLHDIISDILASGAVPRDEKRRVIYAALEEFRDTTRNVMTREEWRAMGEHMGGLRAMGGPALGLLPGERAADTVGDRPAADHGAMHGAAVPDERRIPQEGERERVRRVVEAVARFTEAGNFAALDTLFAPDVRIIDGTGLDRAWTRDRDGHLEPELEGFEHLTYDVHDVEPEVRGNVAWAPFRYEIRIQNGDEGPIEVEGRGTAVLEKRGDRWWIVHLHTSGTFGRPEGRRP